MFTTTIFNKIKLRYLIGYNDTYVLLYNLTKYSELLYSIVYSKM
jgi:hypothetical protein